MWFALLSAGVLVMCLNLVFRLRWIAGSRSRRTSVRKINIHTNTNTYEETLGFWYTPAVPRRYTAAHHNTTQAPERASLFHNFDSIQFDCNSIRMLFCWSTIVQLWGCVEWAERRAFDNIDSISWPTKMENFDFEKFQQFWFFCHCFETNGATAGENAGARAALTIIC